MDGLSVKKEIIKYYNCKIFNSDFFNRDSLQKARALPVTILKEIIPVIFLASVLVLIKPGRIGTIPTDFL